MNMRIVGTIALGIGCCGPIGCKRSAPATDAPLGITVAAERAAPFQWTFEETATVLGHPVKKRITAICQSHEWPLVKRSVADPSACGLEVGRFIPQKGSQAAYGLTELDSGDQIVIVEWGTDGTPTDKQTFDVLSAELAK